MKLKLTIAIAAAGFMLAGHALAQGTAAPSTGSDKSTAPSTSADTTQAGRAGSPTTATSTRAYKSDMSDMKSAASGEQTKAVQQALKDKGNDPGEVDGKMGPKTQAALKAFQKAQGMTASGRVDARTAQALGLESADKMTQPGTSPSASPSTTGAQGTTSTGATTDTSSPSSASGSSSGSTSGATAPSEKK